MVDFVIRRLKETRLRCPVHVIATEDSYEGTPEVELHTPSNIGPKLMSRIAEICLEATKASDVKVLVYYSQAFDDEAFEETVAYKEGVAYIPEETA